MRELDPRRRRWMMARIGLLAATLVAGAGVLIHRAWDLQIEQGPRLRAEAEAQQLRDIRIAPRRGTIYDRHGAELAVSVDVESVYANPRAMRREHVDLEAAASRLAAVLGVDRERILARLSSDRHFAWIERQVTPEEAQAVRRLGIPGVELTREARRFYPNGDLAAHVLGFANVDGVGIEGIELSMDEHLRGSTESVLATVDRRGRVVFSQHLLDHRASQGDDVYLTIDKTIQHLAEREIALAVRTFEAAAGSVVVLDPRNGEVLAIANHPSYDPNDPAAAPASHRRNRAITDRFEPGSTIKPFTIATALAAGTLEPDEWIDCAGDRSDGRRLTIDDDGATIGEADGHRFGLLTPAQILAHSSNIGAARIGLELGAARLYRGLRRFGFGEPTQAGLPGETGGVLRHHRRWYAMDLATISFGHGLSVTTLQLAAAYAALANGGRLMRPRIVRRIVDARAEIVHEARPEVLRQAVPRGTARLVTDMLTGVTAEAGTGAEAAIDGVLVAGKTGTAQKADYVRGGYRGDAYIASFVGFVPADAPRLVIAVVVDEPTIDHYGGVVAGPVFRRIGEAALRHLGVPAAGGGEALADIARGRRRAAGGQRSANDGERGDADDERGDADGERGDADDERHLAALEPLPEPGDGESRVPSLHAATARRALAALSEAGLLARIEGSGLVIAQTPAAGAIVPRGTTVRIVLEPRAWDPPGAPIFEETARAPEPSPRTDALAVVGHGRPPQ